jgi:hypothetical protein
MVRNSCTGFISFRRKFTQRGHVKKKKDNCYLVLELDPVNSVRRQK